MRTAFFGDYDSMSVVSNGSPLPILTRFFADSSSGTCNDVIGRPQHVSVLASLSP